MRRLSWCLCALLSSIPACASETSADGTNSGELGNIAANIADDVTMVDCG